MGKAVIFLVVFGLIFGGCARKEDIIKIGGVGPLTGGSATYGRSTRNASIMAVEEVNARGGLQIGERRYKLLYIFGDDEGRPEAAAMVYRKLIDQDRVTAIIGTVMSKCSLAGAPIAQEAGVPMITPTSTNPKVTLTGDYIFRACFIDPFQGTVMANFAYHTLGKRRAGVLFDMANDYNKGLAEFFKRAFEELGGEVVAYEAFVEEDKTHDFTPQLTKIKAAKPDVLFLPNYYSSVALVAKQAKEIGLDVTLIGGDGWDSPELIRLGGEAIEGGFFSTHFSKDDPSKHVQEFVKRYKARYGTPPDALAALAYDACLILFDAMKRAGKIDREAIKEALAKTKDLRVVSGRITFDENRNPVKSAVILKVEGGKFVYHRTVTP
jgi:branched-chain amino acid transport system substrate-binding protein